MMPLTMHLIRPILASLIVANTIMAAENDPKPTPLPRGSVLLQRFIRAVGGVAAIRDVQSMSASGQIHLPGSEETGQFSWAVADGGRCVFDLTFQNLGHSTYGSNGTIGWESLTLGETKTVREVATSTIESRRRRSNWFELALTLPARARTFDTIGLSIFDGCSAFEIRMVDETDRVHHVFFDTTTHLLLGVRIIERGPLGPADVTIRFGDWKPVGSLLLFHTVSIDHANVHMRLHFEHVSLQDVPTTRFALPIGLKTPTSAESKATHD